MRDRELSAIARIEKILAALDSDQRFRVVSFVIHKTGHGLAREEQRHAASTVTVADATGRHETSTS